MPNMESLTLPERLMIEAADKGDEVKAMELLSDARLNINVQCIAPNQCFLKDVTAMHIAIWKNNISVARMILNHPEYQMTVANKELKTALHFAARHDRIGALAAEMLAHPGAVAAVNLRDEFGFTALHFACGNNNMVWLRELLKIAQIETSPMGGEWVTPMMLAAEDNQSCGLEVLLNHGVDCNAGMMNLFPYNNPLSAATSFGHISNIELLINHGAATTYTATLDLILSSEPNSQMVPINFDCMNMATRCIYENLSYGPLFDDEMKRTEIILDACPQQPDVEDIFWLYKKWFKSEQIDDNNLRQRKLRLLCRIIYKSLGTGIDEHLQIYLLNKYKLTDSEDYRLLIPFRRKCLRFLSALKARKELMRMFEAGNVTQALRLAEPQLNIIVGLYAKDMLYLDRWIDYYINEITSKGFDFHSIFQ